MIKSITYYSRILCVTLLFVTNHAIAAEAFTPDSQPTGWISRPAVTFFDVSSGTESYFQVDFRKDTWMGNVLARDINDVAEIQTTGPWDNLDPTLATAASLLDTANYSTGRKIATQGRPFRWANMTTAEKTSLISEAYLNFVRGDRANEEPNGLSFHQRESVLGDILHSNIYFWDHGATESLYVGSNGGMLHAFDADTGVENWAYVPTAVIPNLSKLAAKTYVHTYYVDGPVSIAKVDASGTLRTILVGALGAGGVGLYALDISSPTAATEAEVAGKVLWELSATGSFANLGYVYGTPRFARLGGTPVVIFGNGYMNPGNGHAVLYIVNAVSGALVAAIDTGNGSTASPNGLSSVTLYDGDHNGQPEYAYAGDLDGSMWKFDLSNNSVSLLKATSPAQAITSAPVVQPHPLGGQMVAFVTGRILTSGDKVDSSTHYAYGVWDGAPDSNTTFLTQTLTSTTYGSDAVRTVTDNAPNWASGGHKGWKVALEPGERVVGEQPFYHNGRFYFLATNPTQGTGANWLHELVMTSGGAPMLPIFDLNKDGDLDDDDLAANGEIPVAKYLSSGIVSQPLLVEADGLATTLYAYHPDLPIDAPQSDDPGVSGGHFDYDIYYYDDATVTTTITTPNYDDFSIVNNYCKKTVDVSKNLDKVWNGCSDNAPGGTAYKFLSDYSVGAVCKPNTDLNKVEYYHTLTCNTVTVTTDISHPYKKVDHDHEYDDKFDVTGVNMLNASNPQFNLVNAIADGTKTFKVLVINQYLNPAAKVSTGGAAYESVQTYGNLASQTSASDLLANLPIYSRDTIGTFVFNLPLDAFKSKDWWGDGSAVRAGLIPTQTGCVNGVSTLGVPADPGPNGERFNGALTFQLITSETPWTALELNGPDVSYGWRVMAEFFNDYVLAEYTAFWHHPNGACYGDLDWVADPPEDFEGKTTGTTPVGTADPKDGIFGLVVTSTVTTVNGNTTTTTTTYSDGSDWIKSETLNDNGSITVYQQFRDGTEQTVTYFPGDGGEGGFIDPNSGSPLEERTDKGEGRQTWRDILN